VAGGSNVQGAVAMWTPTPKPQICVNLVYTLSGGLDPWTSFLATPTYVKVSGEPLCGHLGRDPFVETGFGFES